MDQHDCSSRRNGKDGDRMRKTSQMDSSFDGVEGPPTLEEIRSWGKSFENLMENPKGRKVFEDFLKTEYSDENIHFWEACEDLKKEKEPGRIQEKAKQIYQEFVSLDSPTEVHLDSTERNIVDSNMVFPTANAFDEAQEMIYSTMRQDSYFSFVTSPFFKRMIMATPNTTRNRRPISKGRRMLKGQTL